MAGDAGSGILLAALLSVTSAAVNAAVEAGSTTAANTQRLPKKAGKTAAAVADRAGGPPAAGSTTHRSTPKPQNWAGSAEETEMKRMTTHSKAADAAGGWTTAANMR